jgi:hypothetical protein
MGLWLCTEQDATGNFESKVKDSKRQIGFRSGVGFETGCSWNEQRQQKECTIEPEYHNIITRSPISKRFLCANDLNLIF